MIAMLLSELCNKIPGRVLSRRVHKDDFGLPELIMFLDRPGALRSDVLYLLEAAAAERILPECTAPMGSTVICAGALASSVSCQVNINLVAVECDLFAVYNAAAEFVAEGRRNNSLAADRLQRRFASIVEENFPSDYQVDTICGTFPKHIKSSYCVICVESEDAPGRAVRDVQMRSDLAALFSEDNITVYDNDTIIIHSYDGFTHPPILPLEELSKLLTKYNACAGVSNGMRKTAQMRMMYILAKKALESGKVLFDGAKNVFFYDDTMLFSIMSLAAVGYEEQYGSDDIILLGSPIILNIIKHDPQGKRELLETLFQYVVNGRSTSKTAEAMHMHRNTVQNRISLIEEITGEQFSKDGMLQAKLLLTYYAIQYYTRVWNKKLVLSPLYGDEDASATRKKPGKKQQ